MIKYTETIEGNLTNGLTWKIEKENSSPNLWLTILWANGEELETIELNPTDIDRLGELFTQAKSWYGAIAPSERGNK